MRSTPDSSPALSAAALAERLLDVAGAIVVVLDRDGRVVLTNRQGCALIGRDEADIVGRDWFDLAEPPSGRADARREYMRTLAVPADHDVRFDSTVLTAEGEERIITWRSALLVDAAGSVAGVVRAGDDITERRISEVRLRHFAYHDRVTGLPNRALLEEHLRLAVARARRNGTGIALVHVDLDRFAVVNQALGRAGGDEVRRQTARRLRTATRAGDLLCRAGDDAFLLMISDVAEAPLDAAVVATRLAEESLATPFTLGGSEFTVTASIGSSVFPDHCDDADALLRRAEEASQQGRRRGDNAA